MGFFKLICDQLYYLGTLPLKKKMIAIMDLGHHCFVDTMENQHTIVAHTVPWSFVASAKPCIWVWVKMGFSKNSLGDMNNPPIFGGRRKKLIHTHLTDFRFQCQTFICFLATP